MAEFDPGPPQAFADHFAQAPDFSPFKKFYWYDWGPVFYRGRLDGSARVVCIASDPGPTERLTGRNLVGDAGQRVQGFLAKLGLTRSYVCLNAHIYALLPSRGEDGLAVLADPGIKAWRNQLYDMLKTPSVKAVIAFGEQASEAVRLWPGKGSTPVFHVPHPSSRDNIGLINAWRAAIPQLRQKVTPDSDGTPLPPNYGSKFLEADYQPIPARDLPFGLPAWVGDDSWGRTSHPRHNNSVKRAPNDLKHTIIWIAPRS